jgi:hypothetical protein
MHRIGQMINAILTLLDRASLQAPKYALRSLAQPPKHLQQARHLPLRKKIWLQIVTAKWTILWSATLMHFYAPYSKSSWSHAQCCATVARLFHRLMHQPLPQLNRTLQGAQKGQTSLFQHQQPQPSPQQPSPQQPSQQLLVDAVVSFAQLVTDRASITPLVPTLWCALISTMMANARLCFRSVTMALPQPPQNQLWHQWQLAQPLRERGPMVDVSSGHPDHAGTKPQVFVSLFHCLLKASFVQMVTKGTHHRPPW